MERTNGIYDFHTHTSLSDGELPLADMLRHAVANGYVAIAVTEHYDAKNPGRFLPQLVRDCAAAQKEFAITVIPGVEITQLPPTLIDTAAKSAKDLGARLVVVHGETLKNPKDPVTHGTNRAALASRHVDILGHPGYLTSEDATLAKERGIFIEISANDGHAPTNVRVAKLALAAGAMLLVDSDAHRASALLTAQRAQHIALEAGLTPEQARAALQDNPRALLKKLGLT